MKEANNLSHMVVVDGIGNMPELKQPLHLAIGMFDGIHIGHQAVIEACLNTAKNVGGSAGVLTFWPHPSKILRPDHAVPQIMPLESKLWTLDQKGIDYTIVQSFEDSFAQVSAEEFVPRLKSQLPKLHTLFVGENFRFGKGRKGDIQLLSEHAKKENVHVVSMEQCKFDGEVISSTRIRGLLQSERFNEINCLLGHPYTVRGQTAPGRKVGRTIGFPTLNIDWSPELKPPYGVYATRLVCHNDTELPNRVIQGISNYGIRPTYDVGDKPILEVHLFEDIAIEYGTQVAVELVHFVRPETKFVDQDALIAQIKLDVTKAKNVLENQTRSIQR